MFDETDHRLMALALELAQKKRYLTRPNPSVGCVLVNDGEIVGEGASEIAGGRHAEACALAGAGDRARGAHAYVTLEPCAHQGRTPPCCDALIAAGIRAATVAVEDLNPLVAGQGIERMRAAGIEVRVGLLGDEAQALNAGYFQRLLTGRPRVVLKTAASIDGATAMASGESQWITGEPARAEVQALRASAGAIITGSGTVLADNPALTVRDPRFNDLPGQPLRVVLDTDLKTATTARVYADHASARIYSATENVPDSWSSTQLPVICAPAADKGRVDIQFVLRDLAAAGVNDVLLEAGAVLSGAFARAGLVDEYRVFLAPKFLGSQTRRMFETPGISALGDALQVNVTDVSRIGGDLMLTLHPSTTRKTDG